MQTVGSDLKATIVFNGTSKTTRTDALVLTYALSEGEVSLPCQEFRIVPWHN